jgi:hypothetical protein
MDGSEETEKELLLRLKLDKWSYWLSGASAVAFGILSFISSNERIGNALFSSLLAGLGAAFVVLCVIQFLGITLFGAIDAARQKTNPFRQGVTFAIVAAVMLGLGDAIVFRGMFVVSPALSLVFNGTLEDTYWSCQGDWEIADEGQFCAHQ